MYTRTDGLVYAPDKGRANQPLSGSFLGDNKYGVTAPRAPVANAVDNSGGDNGVELDPTIDSAGQFQFFSDNAIPPYIPPAPPTMRTGLSFDPKNRGGAGSEELRKKLGEFLKELDKYSKWLIEGGEYDLVKGLYGLAALANLLQDAAVLGAFLKTEGPALLARLLSSAKSIPGNELGMLPRNMEPLADSLVDLLTKNAKRNADGTIKTTTGHNFERTAGPFKDAQFSVEQKDGSIINVRFDIDNSHGMGPHINVEISPPKGQGAKIRIGPNDGHLPVKVN
jgi:hypothetical protein